MQIARQKSRRRGFTLVETVVTVGIIAALAAVVYPAVVKQFDTADPTRAAEDLNNLRTGAEAFGVNVRPELPSDIEDLVNRPVITNPTFDSSATGAVYSSSEQAAWNGPYVALSIPNATAGTALKDTVVTTGFGGKIINGLLVFDVAAATLTGGDSVARTAAPLGPQFLAVRIVGLSGAAFNAINQLIDGPTENAADLRRNSGRLRCPYSSAPTDQTPCPNAYFLAVPIR